MDEEFLSFDDMSVWMESCALTGAAAFFAGLRGCAVIVNGPLWCYLFTQRHIEQSQSDISHRMKCTQLDNDAIVFGAEAYLREALQPHIEQPPALLAVISGSSASTSSCVVKTKSTDRSSSSLAGSSTARIGTSVH